MKALALVLTALLLLHRRYLATLVRLGNRLQSTCIHSGHKNYVRLPIARVSLFTDVFNILFLSSLIDYAIFVLLTAQFLPESRAHALNAGASVWGLDWCPIHPDDRPRKNL